jgi:hypothetical protein
MAKRVDRVLMGVIIIVFCVVLALIFCLALFFFFLAFCFFLLETCPDIADCVCFGTLLARIL